MPLEELENILIPMAESQDISKKMFPKGRISHRTKKEIPEMSDAFEFASDISGISVQETCGNSNASDGIQRI